MGVLAMLELKGETEQLLAASADLERRLGAIDGVLTRIVAATDDGIAIFQLWESPEARQRHADDPHHKQALNDSGILDVMRASRSRTFEAATRTA
jgi:hypothetical protein